MSHPKSSRQDSIETPDLITLTKAELAEVLFERVGLNKREAKDIVEDFFAEIRDALERSEEVKLSSFGNFKVRSKPQRPGRNPKTGEEIPITARRVVTFHASQKLKEAVSDGALPEAVNTTITPTAGKTLGADNESFDMKNNEDSAHWNASFLLDSYS